MKHTLLFLCLAPIYAIGQSPAGYWKGAITLPSLELEIMVELMNQDLWTGTIDIPVQGLRGFTLSNITINDEKVYFEMAGIPGEPHFNGKLSASGETISGKFEQSGSTFDFALSRAEKDQNAGLAPAFEINPIPGEGGQGFWKGILKAGPMKLRLVFHISGEKDEPLKVIIHSLDQNAQFPADSITLEGKKMIFEIKQIQAGYVATLNNDGSMAEGIWSQMGQDFPLNMARVKNAHEIDVVKD